MSSCAEGSLRAADRSHVLIVVVEALQGAAGVELDPSHNLAISHKLAKRNLCAIAVVPQREIPYAAPRSAQRALHVAWDELSGECPVVGD